MREWLADRLDGLMNPILIKEVQQGFRGRGLLVGAITALGFCLGSYVYTALSGGHSGDDLFQVLSLSMAAVALIIVPIGTGRLLKHEIEDGTADLIAVTGLTAWTNISGRLQAATLKILLLLALMAPFAVVTVLLGGIGFEEVLITVAFNLVVAVGFCAIALMLTSTAALRSPVLRVAVNVQYLLFPALGFFAATELLPDLVRHSNLEQVADWLLWLLVLVGFGCPFSISVAADLVQHDETRSFARSKILLGAVLFVAMVPAMSQATFGTPSSGVPEALWFMCFMTLLVFCMLWSGVQRPRPIYGVGWFFSGGFGPTVTYLGLGCFMLALLSGALALDVSTRIMALAGMAYFVLIGGTAQLIRRLVDPHARQALLYPGVFVVLALAVVFANVLHVDIAERPHHDIEMMLFPVEYFRDNGAFWRSGHLLLLPVFLGIGYGWLGRRRHKSAWRVLAEEPVAAETTAETPPARQPIAEAQTPPPLPAAHLRSLRRKLAS